MSDHSRSITFTIDDASGEARLRISVAELQDGSLRFSYDVIGDDELRGLFFDLRNSALIPHLEATGPQITRQRFSDEGVTNLHDGNNINGTGETFDAGLTFGTSGVGQDQTRRGTFVLSTDDATPLTLDDIAHVMFGARFASDGLKLTALAPAAPDARDDALVADEDTAADEAAPNANLIGNDTDADGDTLTVVAVDGEAGRVGVPVVLATGGVLVVNSDGSFDFDPNGAYDDLAAGESRSDSFTYRITDELADPDNQGFDTATVHVTVRGRNDAPVISLQGADSAAATVRETHAGLSTAGSLTVGDVDLSDEVVARVSGLTTAGVDADPSLPSHAALLAMLAVSPRAPALLLDSSEDTDSLAWAFDSAGQAFDYLADSEVLTLTYTVMALDEHGASDTQDVVITVAGSNDRPVASNVVVVAGEDALSVQGAFVASDLDRSDLLSYQILGQPMDAQGHRYGQVVNNGNGGFTFMPLDDFQFLEAKESRDLTFQYVAIDDSGTGSDTSEAKTVTIQVNGAYDAPTVVSQELNFGTEDQSMWQTGDAFTVDWRNFYGLSWASSSSKTLINGASKQIVPEINDPLFGSEIYGGLTVSTPSIGISAATSGRVGISPYFKLDSGSVDADVRVDATLTYDVQYEDSDTVHLDTSWLLDGASTFGTTSPSVVFGLDLVFEFSANANLLIGASSFGGASSLSLFNVSVNVDEAEPVAGYPTSGNGDTATLIEFSSISGISSDIFEEPAFEEDGEYTIPVGDSSLVLSFPYIETTGGATDPDTLKSHGEDDVAVLTLDVDDILSKVVKYVPPMRVSGDKALAFDFDLPQAVNDFLKIPDVHLNLLALKWDFELVDVDLIGTLTAVQDFQLDIESLPLKVVLENGDEITGQTLGSTISFDLPDWDVDTLGDADGQMDFDVQVDMDALFNNLTTMDFSLDLLLRALKGNMGYTSDIIGNSSIQIFGSSNGGFLVADTIELLDVSPLATLVGDPDPAVSGFDLTGWNQALILGAFDIA